MKALIENINMRCHRTHINPPILQHIKLIKIQTIHVLEEIMREMKGIEGYVMQEQE